MPDVVLGLAGWSYPEWVGPFYAPGTPSGGFLKAYARAFRFVEVDGTYYAAPTREDAARWAESVPDGFRFSPKLPKRIVGDKRLADAEDDVASFLSNLAPLRTSGKLGPILATMPPSFRRGPDAARLSRFVETWPRDVPLAVELRHPSWWVDETYDVLRANGVILAWSTTEHGRTPPVLTAGEAYVRLIGDRALDAITTRWDRILRQQDAEIAYWKGVLAECGALRAFIVANNHFMGYAPSTAVLLARALGAPEPDLAAAARDPRQRALGSWETV